MKDSVIKVKICLANVYFEPYMTVHVHVNEN